MSLRIILHTKTPDDSVLQRQWNLLARQTERPEVFYTCEWALAMQAAYEASLKPLLFTGYDGDELVAVACLATDSTGKIASFLCANTADYCEFVSAPQWRAEFIDGVFAELQRLKVSEMKLANLPADSATPAALEVAARRHGFYLYIRPAYVCPQVDLGSVAQRRELKATLMNKRQLRRCLRAMEREGPVECTYLRSWPHIEAALPGFIAAHVARYRATQRVSILTTPERRLFLEDLARRFGQTGTVTLTILKIETRPVAWSYGFQFEGSWFLYQTTFDTRDEDNSPGYCILGKILMEACDNTELQRVDMGLGEEGYKAWFANSTRQTVHATLTRSLSGHLKNVARYRTASLLKRSPQVESTVRALLQPFRSRRDKT